MGVKHEFYSHLQLTTFLLHADTIFIHEMKEYTQEIEDKKILIQVYHLCSLKLQRDLI